MLTKAVCLEACADWGEYALPSGKGVRVLQRVGVMEQAQVVLPAAVEGVWACWRRLFDWQHV